MAQFYSLELGFGLNSNLLVVFGFGLNTKKCPIHILPIAALPCMYSIVDQFLGVGGVLILGFILNPSHNLKKVSAHLTQMNEA